MVMMVMVIVLLMVIVAISLLRLAWTCPPKLPIACISGSPIVALTCLDVPKLAQPSRLTLDRSK